MLLPFSYKYFNTRNTDSYIIHIFTKPVKMTGVALKSLKLSNIYNKIYGNQNTHTYIYIQYIKTD